MGDPEADVENQVLKIEQDLQVLTISTPQFYLSQLSEINADETKIRPDLVDE